MHLPLASGKPYMSFEKNVNVVNQSVKQVIVIHVITKSREWHGSRYTTLKHV